MSRSELKRRGCGEEHCGKLDPTQEDLGILTKCSESHENRARGLRWRNRPGPRNTGDGDRCPFTEE